MDPLAFAVGGMTVAGLGLAWSLRPRPRRPAKRLERLTVAAVECGCGCGTRAVTLGTAAGAFGFESRAEVDDVIRMLAEARDDLWPEPARALGDGR